MTTVSRLSLTSSIMARQFVLNSPAGIRFMMESLRPRDNYGHYTMVISRDLNRHVNIIYLDTYILCRVYIESGICVRNHCGAEPPRDIEPPGLVPTVGGRDRASASYVAADRVKTLASAARGRFRGIHSGRTAPSLPAEA